MELTTRHGSGHPWIFRRMVGEPYSELDPGTMVEVLDKHGIFVGRGFYNPHSEIAVRLLTCGLRFASERWALTGARVA